MKMQNMHCFKKRTKMNIDKLIVEGGYAKNFNFSTFGSTLNCKIRNVKSH